MGGYGSTRWGGYTPKRTVEEALKLSTKPLRETLREGRALCGALEWRWSRTGNTRASIGYEFEPDPAPGRLRLFYVKGHGTEQEERLDYPVALDTTLLPFGGVRWWFLCPLVRSGHPCRRRCGKLYLPPGARYFGCRTCYDLTYESCQEAHKFDSLYRHLAQSIGCSFEHVKVALSGR